MKPSIQFIRLASVATIGLAAACTTENEPIQPTASDAEIVIFPQQADETRVTLNGTSYGWQEGDVIGVYIDAATPTTNSRGALKRNAAGEAYFTATVKASKIGDKVYAYYPYASVNPKNGDQLVFAIPSEQTQKKADDFNGSQLPMAAFALPLTEDLGKNATASLSLKFSPAAAIADYSIWSSIPAYSTERVHSVTFSSEGTNLSSAGTDDGIKVSVDALLAGTIESDASALTGKSVKVSLEEPFSAATAAANASSAFLVVPAVKAVGTLRTIVRTDAAFYEFTANKGAAGITFARNSVKRFSLDLAKAQRTEAVMPSVSVVWLPDGKVAQSSGSTLYNVPFVLSPSSGCVAVYYTCLQKNSLPADLEADLLASGTKVTQWTDGTIKGWCEGILAMAGDSPWVVYAMGIGSDGSHSKVVSAELNPATLDPSLSSGPFSCMVKTRLTSGANYGNIDTSKIYKDAEENTIYFIKNGYEITASDDVASYKMYWGLYDQMKNLSDAQLIALANLQGSATVVVAQENPKELPVYMVDFEQTATIIVWKDQVGRERLYKGHIIRSFRNGEFASVYGWPKDL